MPSFLVLVSFCVCNYFLACEFHSLVLFGNLVHVVYLLTGLRKKTVSPGVSGLDDHLRNPGTTDLFGSSDAIVKHLLEVSTVWARKGEKWAKPDFLTACF